MNATRGTTGLNEAGSAIEGRPDEGMRRSTGRGRSEWFALLDEWGAAGRPYREIAAWLTGTHDLTDWWAQKLIVEYEEARGLRPPGIRRDGSFEVGASKTIAVSLSRLYAAFVDPASRARWLTDARPAESGPPSRSVRHGSTGRTDRRGSSSRSRQRATIGARSRSSTSASPMPFPQSASRPSGANASST